MSEPNKSVDPSFVGIAQSLARLEQHQEDFRRELLGNGQPGRVQLLELSVTAAEKELRSMDRKIFYFSGAIGVGLLFVKALVSKLFSLHIP
jgi:hypothetical protein